MTDHTWIRNFNNKGIYLSGEEANEGTLLFENSITTKEYASGFAGYGARLNRDESLKWSMGLDNLTVRGRMRIYELLINQIRATNGSV